MQKWFLITTVVFAILRFVLPSSGEIHSDDIFKDLAHLWVGFLLASALFRGGSLESKILDWWMFWGICGVEIVAFLASQLR
jgi:hypothetical protein